MVRSDALHSRLVSGLRIALPLLALGLLSTLFLVSREVDPSRALPYASVDAEDLARDPRITAPRFSSTAEDGSAITLTAETMRIAAGRTDGTEAETVVATLVTPDGAARRFAAERASVDADAGVLALRGGVALSDDLGHRLTSGGIDIALDRTRVVSPGPVTGIGPLGRIDAGAMRLELPVGGSLQPHLRFTGGVRVVHRPGGEEALP